MRKKEEERVREAIGYLSWEGKEMMISAREDQWCGMVWCGVVSVAELAIPAVTITKKWAVSFPSDRRTDRQIDWTARQLSSDLSTTEPPAPYRVTNTW
jgi:hypothetical protein